MGRYPVALATPIQNLVHPGVQLFCAQAFKAEPFGAASLSLNEIDASSGDIQDFAEKANQGAVCFSFQRWGGQTDFQERASARIFFPTENLTLPGIGNEFAVEFAHG